MGHFLVFIENSSFSVRLANKRKEVPPPIYRGLIYTWVSSDSALCLVPQALTFIIFICFTASISAYMAAALLEFFITLAFLFLYATQYYQRFDRLNWPCLVRSMPLPPHPGLFLLLIAQFSCCLMTPLHFHNQAVR